MQVHLKPLEFIQAIEGECLSRAAVAHLNQCALCHETLRDLQDTRQIVKRSDAPEIPRDDAFWNEYTQTVCRTAQQAPSDCDNVWWAWSASLVLALSSLLLLLMAIWGRSWHKAPEPRAERSGLSETAYSGAANQTDAVGSDFEWEGLDIERYLYTQSAFYENLQRELSLLRIDPEIWTETESGVYVYIE